MPIFVDGVEIEEVFVDGIAMDTVFSDGVQVFSAFTPNIMFDSFDDVIGTTVPNHIANTGQSWLNGEFDANSLIQNASGGSGFGGAASAARTVMIAPVLPQLTSYYCKVSVGTLLTGGLQTNTRIYIGTAAAAAGNQSYVQYLKGSGQIAIINGANILGAAISPQLISQTYEIECWLDGIEIQGSVIINGVTTLTSKVTLITPFNNPIRTAEAYHREASFGSDSQPNIWNYDFQEFQPGTVPFP